MSKRHTNQVRGVRFQIDRLPPYERECVDELADHLRQAVRKADKAVGCLAIALVCAELTEGEGQLPPNPDPGS